MIHCVFVKIWPSIAAILITQNEEREDMSTGRTIKRSGRNATFPFHFQWGPLRPETAEVETSSTFGCCDCQSCLLAIGPPPNCTTQRHTMGHVNRTPNSPHRPSDTSAPPPWRQIPGYVPKSLHHCQPKGGTTIAYPAVVLCLRPGRQVCEVKVTHSYYNKSSPLTAEVEYVGLKDDRGACNVPHFAIVISTCLLSTADDLSPSMVRHMKSSLFFLKWVWPHAHRNHIKRMCVTKYIVDQWWIP